MYNGVPKWLQSRARVSQNEPESPKNGAKIQKSALNRPKWLPDGFQDHFPQKAALTLDNFGVPSGTQKSTKNRSLAQKEAQGSDFVLIFVVNIAFLILGLDF